MRGRLGLPSRSDKVSDRWSAGSRRRSVCITSCGFRLAPAHPQVDREAGAPDGARPRALADDATAQRSPRADAAHRADAAAGASDPPLGDGELQSDQPRNAAARRWRRRRRCRGRWRRRRRGRRRRRRGGGRGRGGRRRRRGRRRSGRGGGGGGGPETTSFSTLSSDVSTFARPPAAMIVLPTATLEVNERAVFSSATPDQAFPATSYLETSFSPSNVARLVPPIE